MRKKAGEKTYTRSEIMTWDGPVVYNIPARFHDIYKDHVPDKVGKVQLEKITLGDIVKKKESGEEDIAKFQEK